MHKCQQKIRNASSTCSSTFSKLDDSAKCSAVLKISADVCGWDALPSSLQKVAVEDVKKSAEQLLKGVSLIF